MAKASPKWWRIHVHKWPLHVISVVNVVCKSINKAPNGLLMNAIDCSIAVASQMLSEEYTCYIHCTMKKSRFTHFPCVFITKSNQLLFIYLYYFWSTNFLIRSIVFNSVKQKCVNNVLDAWKMRYLQNGVTVTSQQNEFLRPFCVHMYELLLTILFYLLTLSKVFSLMSTDNERLIYF